MGYKYLLKVTEHFFFMAALTAIVFITIGCSEKPVEKKEVVRPVKIITVKSGADEVRRFPGTVRANQRVDLSFNVSGTLMELPVNEGDDVKKGKLIARLDQRDFISRMNSAQAKYKKAKTDYERYAKLLKEGVISQAHFDQIERNLRVYKSDYMLAKKDYDDSSLKAPFDGRIAKKHIDNFMEIRSKEPIVSLQDISHIEVLVDVPEWVMVPIRKRGSADVTAEFHALPNRKFKLKLKEFTSDADPQTQTYRIVMVMPAPSDVNILPGMTATVTVSGLIHNTNIKIPVSAVFADEAGNNYVWLTDDEMRVKKQGVEVGNVTGSDIYIIKGITTGNKVVTAGVNYLKPGMKVKQLKEKTEE